MDDNVQRAMFERQTAEKLKQKQLSGKSSRIQQRSTRQPVSTETIQEDSSSVLNSSSKLSKLASSKNVSRKISSIQQQVHSVENSDIPNEDIGASIMKATPTPIMTEGNLSNRETMLSQEIQYAGCALVNGVQGSNVIDDPVSQQVTVMTDAQQQSPRLRRANLTDLKTNAQQQINRGANASQPVLASPQAERV